MSDGAVKQIMVTVKKSDGTFVKVPLSELKKPATPAVVTPPKLPISKPISMVRPVAPKTVTKLQPTKLSKEDFSSPLSDSLSTVSSSESVVSRPRLDQTDEVIKKLSFKVPADFVNRLRSIAQLRLKDVRGEKETKEMVLRSIKDGGLGLTMPQADELQKVCQEVLGKVVKATPVKNIKELKKDTPKSIPSANLPMVEPSEIPEPYIPPPVPANTTPFNSFVYGQKVTVEKPKFNRESILDKKPIVAPVVTALPKAVSTPSSFRISHPVTPQGMQDVIGREKTMGPLEELKYITLTDFRRLSKNPAEAAKRLGQKFLNLKEESYILFLQAWSAWRASPLFQEYLRSVLNSLQKGTVLGVTLADLKESIQMPEIEALIQMEKELG